MAIPELVLKFNQINNLFLGAKRALIATHKNPDGDGIGSMLALNFIFKKNNIDAVLFCQDPPPRELNFLPYWHEIKNSYGKNKYDVIVALDYGDFQRTGLVLEPENINTPLITIDHHYAGNHRGHIRIVEPQLSSTSEIIYYFFQENNIEIDKNIATCLLAGIFFDTGGFRHSNTSQAVLQATGDLLSRGGNLNKIIENAYKIKSISHSRLLGKVLSDLEILDDSGLAFAIIKQDDFQEYDVSGDAAEGIANFMCIIPEAKFSLLLTEEPNGQFRGSLRSEEFKNIDVSHIANLFGGGGHKLAAGFTTDLKPEDIIGKIKQAVAR